MYKYIICILLVIGLIGSVSIVQAGEDRTYDHDMAIYDAIKAMNGVSLVQADNGVQMTGQWESWHCGEGRVIAKGEPVLDLIDKCRKPDYLHMWKGYQVWVYVNKRMSGVNSIVYIYVDTSHKISRIEVVYRITRSERR